MDTRVPLFVFYNLVRSHTWEYAELPHGWSWVGRGSTRPTDTTNNIEDVVSNCLDALFEADSSNVQNDGQYAREEQFGGPGETRQAARVYLTEVFHGLEDSGYISGFRVSDSFDP